VSKNDNCHYADITTKEEHHVYNSPHHIVFY